MTCCIGKARIYYNEPIGFKLKYSGSVNGEILADEPLTATCEKEPEEGKLYTLIIDYNATAISWAYSHQSESGQQTYLHLIAPISVYKQATWRNNWYGRDVLHYDLWYSAQNLLASPIYIQAGTGGFWYRDSIDYSYRLIREDDGEDRYNFKVIGEETGTIYREIGGLNKCPKVNNLGCVMGEEKYVDTYMGGINRKLLRYIPCFAKIPFLTEYKECIKTKKTNNLFGKPVLNVVKYLEADIPDLGWKDIGFESGILSIPIIEGCPDPPVKVVCCPDGDCEPPCPPDTDCTLDCGDFVCCYKNGKVIKTVRK